MSKSVSCSNPWCSPRELCVHCKPNTATTAPVTHDQPKRLQDEPEPGRVVQSDPSQTMQSILLWTKGKDGAWRSGPFIVVERLDGQGWNAARDDGKGLVFAATLTECVATCERLAVAERPTPEAITAAARADAFDDAAAIVARQYKIGGLNLTTMESCMKASWMFSNEAYSIRDQYGLPQPGATEYMPEAEERLRRTIFGDRAVIPEGHVKMPTSEAEANAMVLLAEAFLKGRAEEAAIKADMAGALKP